MQVAETGYTGEGGSAGTRASGDGVEVRIVDLESRVDWKRRSLVRMWCVFGWVGRDRDL